MKNKKWIEDLIVELKDDIVYYKKNRHCDCDDNRIDIVGEKIELLNIILEVKNEKNIL